MIAAAHLRTGDEVHTSAMTFVVVDVEPRRDWNGRIRAGLTFVSFRRLDGQVSFPGSEGMRALPASDESLLLGDDDWRSWSDTRLIDATRPTSGSSISSSQSHPAHIRLTI